MQNERGKPVRSDRIMLSRYVSIIEFDFFLYRVYTTYPVEKVNNYVGSSSLIAQILDEHRHKLAHIHVDSSLKISRVINFLNTSKLKVVLYKILYRSSI